MRSAVDKAYDKLVAADILYPVSYNDWASPVVHVQKDNGELEYVETARRLTSGLRMKDI